MGISRVFGIEAQWKDQTELSAKPMLEAVAGYHGASTEHRVARTPEELRGHLLEWDELHSACCFVHLWFHGSSGHVCPNDSAGLGLDDILAAYGSKGPPWANCVMHFGACSTMSEDSSKLHEFVEKTGLSAISGYECDVGWIEPLALESLYLYYLLEALRDTPSDTPGATEKHMRIVRDKLANSRRTAAFCQALGFKMVVKGD